MLAILKKWKFFRENGGNDVIGYIVSILLDILRYMLEKLLVGYAIGHTGFAILVYPSFELQ